MPTKINIIGRTFGKLKVIADADPYVFVTKLGKRLVYKKSLCECLKCGTRKAYKNVFLLKRAATECHCNQTGLFKHGHAGYLNHTKTYHSWATMIARCTNEEHPRYSDYGGRGITVSEEWKDFSQFLKNMGAAPAGMTIERVDNNKGYCRENCRWATKAEQNRNKRNIPLFTVRGVTGPLRVICRHFDRPYPRTAWRIRHGWPAEQAVFGAPLGKADYPVECGQSSSKAWTLTVRGVTGSLKFLCRHFSVPYATALRRIRKGWAPEAVLFTAPDASKVRYPKRV